MPRFFALTCLMAFALLAACDSSEPDTMAPFADILSPVGGSDLSGTVTVRYNALDDQTDESAIRTVLEVDGAAVGVSSTTGSIEFNTFLVANGPRTLTVRAQDEAGNSAPSPPVSVTISN